MSNPTKARKPRPHALDPYAAELDQWFGVENISLAEAAQRLSSRGWSGRLSTLSKWWEARRPQRVMESVLSDLRRGSELGRQVEATFGENPAPELATLIRVLKHLVLQFSLQGKASPELMELSVTLLRPVLAFAKIEERREDRKLVERRLALAEQREAKAKETLGDSTLTPEQQTAKFREIFGLA